MVYVIIIDSFYFQSSNSKFCRQEINITEYTYFFIGLTLITYSWVVFVRLTLINNRNNRKFQLQKPIFIINDFESINQRWTM